MEGPRQEAANDNKLNRKTLILRALANPEILPSMLGVYLDQRQRKINQIPNGENQRAYLELDIEIAEIYESLGLLEKAAEAYKDASLVAEGQHFDDLAQVLADKYHAIMDGIDRKK